MNRLDIEKRIDVLLSEFWDKDYNEIFLSMAGLADIWEGQTENATEFYELSPTILAIKIYNDKIFIAQGGGLQTFIKVISPNGIEIYDLGSQLTLMTHTAMDVYGSMAVINDREIVLGYMYINLNRMFMAPYGIDLATLWDNPTAKIVPVRLNDTSWMVMIRDNIYWRGMLVNRESPEDCLPCESKFKMAKDGDAKFECKEIQYGRDALVVEGYKASRDDMVDGVSLSVSNMGGVSKMKRILPPTSNDNDCLVAIDEYIFAFNKTKINYKDVGLIGQKISRNCSKTLYLNMLEIIEYKRNTFEMNIEFTKSFIRGEPDFDTLISDSEVSVSLISAMLLSLSELDSESGFLKSVFSDKIWWGPIWFVLHKDTILADKTKNPYLALNQVSYDSFIETIKTASISAETIEDVNLPMGWIIMANKGDMPVKYGKASMTYFRFPFAICTSLRPIFETNNMDFKSVCEIETRADGMLIWAWDDRSTLWNKQYVRLKVYKVSNDGVFSELDFVDIGYTMSPVDDSAKSVGISEDNDYWIVRDYYVKDSVNGGIGYVETKVDISKDMKELYDSSQVSPYANVNEISGMEGGAKGTIHYSNGLLEQNWEKYDLDDDRIESMPAWGNDGAQYSFIGGYTGYQIHSEDEL